MNFDKAFAALIHHEGGFTDNPKDRGNWTSGKIGVGTCKGTKFGISAMAYPSVDIRNLTLENAKLIYRKDYWDKARCEELPEVIRFDVFDMAVNSGVRNSIITLQKALGVTADGVMGDKTMNAIRLIDPITLDKRISAQRIFFICDLKTFPTFGVGWMRRVATNLMTD